MKTPATTKRATLAEQAAALALAVIVLTPLVIVAAYVFGNATRETAETWMKAPASQSDLARAPACVKRELFKITSAGAVITNTHLRLAELACPES